MEAYTDFATLYDKFMEETPYDDWAARIHDILLNNNIVDGLVCDLGAGTGEMTRRFKAFGYDMIGIDNSENMLMVARDKDNYSNDILYINQDMREFELYGTVRAIISVCDCVNYLVDDEDVVKTFKLVNNYLDPKGLFVFDFNTVYKYRDVIGDATIAENGDDASFIWENYYDAESGINEYDITFFVREGDMYRKFNETHYQKGYTLAEMKRFLKAAGLELVDCFDVSTSCKPTAKSERIAVIARECGK